MVTETEAQKKLGELGEQIGTARYLLGQIVGHETVSRKLRAKAGEAYAGGHDKSALIYRNLAQEVLEWSHKERKLYDSEWRKKREDAFAALDELDAMAKGEGQMTPLEEAKELEAMMRKAFEAFGGLLGSIGCQAPEVRFRHDSIVGMLYMAGKEIEMLIKKWEGEGYG